MSKLETVIANNETQSSEVVISFDQACIVGLEVPAAITSTELKIQAKGEDGQWKDVQLDGADYTVAASANIVQPLRPDVMAAVRVARVVGNSNEGAERTLYFVVRGIK